MIEINSVGYEEDDLLEKAKALSKQLQYKLNKNAAYCLFVSKEKLALKIKNFSLLSVDFTGLSWRHRQEKNLAIVRACKPRHGMTIIDTTAGWGRDASILCANGAKVLMLERHPLMAVLLEDALGRQTEEEKKAHPLSLIKMDANTYLNSLEKSGYPDVIYIDPMHPMRTKSALVKKDLQALQQLIGTDKDALTLLQCALSKSKQRVVVKWPQKLQALLPPDFSIPGKTVRFDVYISNVFTASGC